MLSLIANRNYQSKRPSIESFGRLIVLLLLHRYDFVRMPAADRDFRVDMRFLAVRRLEK